MIQRFGDRWEASPVMGPPLLLLLILSALNGRVQANGNAEVECVMNSVKVLTCTWTRPHPPTENFTFTYREDRTGSPAVPCPEYLTVKHMNIGCKLNISEPYMSFIVELSGSASGSSIRKKFQKHQDYEVECVMNSVKVLTCTWTRPHPPTENYTFTYREDSTGSPAVPCPEYLTVNHMNIGCKLNISEPYMSFIVELSGNASGSSIQKKFQKHQDYVKMDPPHNLTTETTNNLELILRWEQSRGTIPAHCVVYRVRHRFTASDSWTEKIATQNMSSLVSFDTCQNYTFQVKSQLGNCANSLMWSEWSAGATWARNATVCDQEPLTKPASKFLHTAIPVVLTLLLVVIFLAVIGQERIWVILVPQIPNPGKKFEELINGCNVQEWVGVSKEAVEKMKLNYTESFCTVTEDSECTGPDGKTLTSTSPEN